MGDFTDKQTGMGSRDDLAVQRAATTSPSAFGSDKSGTTADTLRDKAAEAGTMLKDKAGRIAEPLREDARNLAEEGKKAGADQVGGMAEAMHKAADELEAQLPQAARFAHDAAASIERASQALRERSLDDLMQSFGRFARTQPATFFGGAVVAGFALSRFLKSSADAPSRGTGQHHL